MINLICHQTQMSIPSTKLQKTVNKVIRSVFVVYQPITKGNKVNVQLNKILFKKIRFSEI